MATTAETPRKSGLPIHTLFQRIMMAFSALLLFGLLSAPHCSGFVHLATHRVHRLSSQLCMASKPLLDKMGQDISAAIGKPYTPVAWKGGFGGGGGAAVGTVEDASGKAYFVKTGNLYKFDMLNAEFQGVREIHMTNTIRVPQPICVGTSDHDAYAVFEKVSMGGYGDPTQMALHLAAMHACTSSNGQFGWKINNTCGATMQPNTYCETWAEFWDTHRLGHMLSLAKRDGAAFPREAELRDKVKAILSAHECVPSLVHGDLWSGNQAYTKEGAPLIFDPAVYVSPGVQWGCGVRWVVGFYGMRRSLLFLTSP
jgi:fructosamine-3-kinase